MSSAQTNRIALVTGASRGIGRALAIALGSRGEQVIAVARTVGGLEEVDAAIQSAGGPRALLAPLDVTDGPGVDRLGGALFERYGRLDSFAHCAAQASPLSAQPYARPEDLEKAWKVNVSATLRLIRSLDPLLRRSARPRALLLTNASKAGLANWGCYGATQAALAAMAASWAAEAPRLAIGAHEPAPTRTALRALTYPGEDPSLLASPAESAARALEALDALEPRKD